MTKTVKHQPGRIEFRPGVGTGIRTRVSCSCGWFADRALESQAAEAMAKHLGLQVQSKQP